MSKVVIPKIVEPEPILLTALEKHLETDGLKTERDVVLVKLLATTIAISKNKNKNKK